MGNELTTEAVRLAMGLQQRLAEVASQNIANASTPGYRVQRLEFSRLKGMLEQVSTAPVSQSSSLLQSMLGESASGSVSASTDPTRSPVNLDHEVASMVSASLDFQALSESLNRHFGLMRLAISGRA